jgi:large subunit ribosomal protein L21
MFMYAIIRAGGKQAKVQSGDVIEVERVKNPAETIEFRPLLVVDDDGATHSDAAVLDGAKVTAKVLGEIKGDKIDIFKYKNKTGYRRRMGHRQTYTQLEITDISLKSAKKTQTKKSQSKSSQPKKSEEAATASSEEE